MMTKQNTILLIALFATNFLLSFRGCVGNLYKVHEETVSLNILIEDSVVSSNILLKFLDRNLKSDSQNFELSDSINGVKLSNEYEKVVHFKKQPDEYYHVSINVFPCKILGVYNERIWGTRWIYVINKVDAFQQRRMQKRFSTEILGVVHLFPATSPPEPAH